MAAPRSDVEGQWEADKLVITTTTANGDQVLKVGLEAGKLVLERDTPNGPMKTTYTRSKSPTRESRGGQTSGLAAVFIGGPTPCALAAGR